MQIEQKHRTLRLLITWVGVIVVAYLVEQAVVHLAGQSTSVLVNATLSMLGDIRVPATLAGYGALGGWALIERKTRQRTTLRHHRRVKELECQIDPARSSSQLTPKGQTNPEDMY